MSRWEITAMIAGTLLIAGAGIATGILAGHYDNCRGQPPIIITVPMSGK